jgi:hypothetical protein
MADMCAHESQYFKIISTDVTSSRNQFRLTHHLLPNYLIYRLQSTEQQHREVPPPAKVHKHNSEQPRTSSIARKNQSRSLSQDRK